MHYISVAGCIHESPSCLSDCTMHYISCCLVVSMIESPSCLSDCTMHYISCCSGCIHESPSCLSDCTMHYISVARLYSWVSFMSQWLHNALHFSCLVVFMISLLHVSVTAQYNESPSCLSDCTMYWVILHVAQWLYNTMSLLHVSVTVQCNESPSCLSDCTMHWVILHVAQWLYNQWVSFMSQWLHNALHFCCQVVFMSLLHVSVTAQCTTFQLLGCIHD